MSLALASGGLSLILPAYADDAASGAPTAAQPPLPKETLTIITSASGKHDFTVEKATTLREQQVGEMFRTTLPADQGMLFLWNAPQQSDMWMENTLVPLDIVFIDADGRIQSITENAVPQSLARISSHGPAMATLELQGGITAKLGIVVGDRVTSASLEAKMAPPASAKKSH
ncbi:DUF192 domain-containing protein [Acetobacter sicerae]|uniref:DUF192 domain-containing protein n=1 Tax=Acetobacter sicerae TaxID=85325 RepID=A0ABS8VQN8_9PROT|nr:DUF192 domain-containing protein [Acetobacter sicerae]MCE0743065.1 DUF192 domain-containing protein [Acetobacter sicerae]